jgi:type I restriction enzyme M protein
LAVGCSSTIRPGPWLRTDEYRADNVFWVPKEARWAHLQSKAKQPTIGKLLDDAMLAKT